MSITMRDVLAVHGDVLGAPPLPEAEKDRILRVLNSHRLARPEPATLGTYVSSPDHPGE